MSIIVNLTSTEEARLFDAATQVGLAPEELVRKLVSEHLPAMDEMRRRIREWQEQDHTPTLAPATIRPGLTPSAALFQQWAEEDAQKTDEEIAADDRLWQDYQEGINEERRKAGMRRHLIAQGRCASLRNT
jgi:hypothetical protein